jgi:MoaA/NifB/PqqE/SkfB family radical SAM enzyme
MSPDPFETAPAAPAAVVDACPVQPLHHLDTLWIQVAGTFCNLSCSHCFVSSGPGVGRHALLGRATVRRHVEEGLALGVKEIYFTGGEPFVHPELAAILGDTLPHAPCTVLTNGTLFTRRRIEELVRLSDASRHSLEIRVSLDGHEPAAHDGFRGEGSFARALEGLLGLERAGLLPIVTATRADGQDEGELRQRYVSMLRGAGLRRPRVKLLPLFRLGRAAGINGSPERETLAGLDPEAFDPTRLQCGSCRAVTSQGVFVCPLLVDEPEGRMGARLSDALGPFRLVHSACHTCHVTGMTCGNA